MANAVEISSRRDVQSFKPHVEVASLSSAEADAELLVKE